MKEIYESPEAKLICFQALERIARDREDMDRRAGDSLLNPSTGVGGKPNIPIG